MRSEQCRSIIQQATKAWITGNADRIDRLFINTYVLNKQLGVKIFEIIDSG